MLCKCGCKQETRIVQRTGRRPKGTSYDYLPGHHLPRLWQQNTQPLAERLQRWTRPDPSGCWLWIGAKTSKGYGHLSQGRGKKEYAHRVAYVLAYGAIPAGYVIDHLCRTPACVNPAHLEAVPPRQNSLRGIHPLVLRHHSGICKRGHPMTPEHRYVRKDRGGHGSSCRLCRNLLRRRGQ